ncbi:hypothetical protein OH805_08815 [Streptomyces sp. NBC_00879]|uniref:hypothetical protein n=1 Tax=Streptomyces sp. NBC_00879 TaxID=2975855 RepID=UPI00386F110E|nr:hypothetical protein OH805_08815 [Streptomyces sp. NBC_00879]
MPAELELTHLAAELARLAKAVELLTVELALHGDAGGAGGTAGTAPPWVEEGNSREEQAIE